MAQTAPPQKPAPPAQAKPGEPRQKPGPPRLPVVIQAPQTKVGAVSLGIARPREGAPAAIARASSSRADGGYASIVVTNTGTKPIRSIVVAAYVRPIGQPDAEPRVFTSPALVTWIPQGGGRTLEPRLIDPATLSEVGSANPQGAAATVDVVRVEFSDGTSWTPGSAPIVESEPEGAQAGGNPFLGGAYPTNTPGLVPPEVIRRVQPRYTSDAMRAKIQGVVILQAVVDASGRVGSTRVVESLDPHFGLDHEANIAANQWLFRPATLNGQPVPAVITLTLEFKLH
jgi:TonB family protein